MRTLKSAVLWSGLSGSEMDGGLFEEINMDMIKLSDISLAYEQTGQGPDIVWLAAGDMPGSSWREFQVPAFGAFRNTTYDARGVGQTRSIERPPWPISMHA